MLPSGVRRLAVATLLLDMWLLNLSDGLSRILIFKIYFSNIESCRAQKATSSRFASESSATW
jgi:hypothetical protein